MDKRGSQISTNVAKPNKWIIMIIGGAAVLMIAFALFFRSRSVSALVKHNYIELESYAAELIENETYGYQPAYKGWDVCYWRSNGMVEFNVYSIGWGSQMTYKGFYYSPNDLPLGYQGTNVDFVKDGKGWRWEDTEGDNWEYTEKIMDKWYFFEMHF